MFTPSTETVEELLGNASSHYLMPIYQRPYSWNKDQVEQLWDDLYEAFEKDDQDSQDVSVAKDLKVSALENKYFLGSVVLVKKGTGVYEIVDGQQRMTTLTILFCVLKTLGFANEVNSYTIDDCIKSSRNKELRLRLSTHNGDQAMFETKIANGIDFDTKDKQVLNTKFFKNAMVLKECIENTAGDKTEKNFEKLNRFINYIFKNTSIIKITCDNESFAIKLFTILNDRGMDLSASDIFKATLMHRLEPNDQVSFNEVWKRIETVAKHNNETISSILTLFLYFTTATNQSKSLQDELKEQFKNSEPISLVLNIEKFAGHLYEILSTTQDKQINCLKYLRQSVYWKTILVTAKYENYNSYEDLKKLLVKYYFQNWVRSGTISRVKQTSFNIIQKIKEKSAISEIKKIISDSIKKDSLENYLNTDDVYSESWLKPILLALEYEYTQRRDFIKIENNLHIEHIMPKKWNKQKLDWSDKIKDSDEAERKLNSLGNLTLLSGNQNITASNRNYSDKKEIFNGNYGKGIDGTTAFEMTQRLMVDYPSWDLIQIDLRAKKLKKEILKLLEI